MKYNKKKNPASEQMPDFLYNDYILVFQFSLDEVAVQTSNIAD